MNKLEKAKQAAKVKHTNDNDTRNQVRLIDDFDAGFDAGVAYQGDFTTINSEDDLPKEEGDYLWETKDGSRHCSYFVNGPIDKEFFAREYIAWREIPKYQQDGGEGE